MDTKKQSSDNHVTPIIPPAQLFVGAPDATHAHAIQYLQKQLCPNNGCATCITCVKIVQNQHHQLLWISPKKWYTRQDLTDIFTQLAFEQNTNETFFFIIDKADHLGNTGHSLLKSLEEPPMGYHFILLAQKDDTILPTIKSRCISYTIGGAAQSPAHLRLYHHFTTGPQCDAYEYTKMIDTLSLSELELHDFLQTILDYYIQQHLAGAHSMASIASIQTYLEHPIPPGSCKLILKDMYLQLQKITLSH